MMEYSFSKLVRPSDLTVSSWMVLKASGIRNLSDKYALSSFLGKYILQFATFLEGKKILKSHL